MLAYLQEWNKLVAKALGPKYVKLASESLWQIRVLLYVRAKLRDHITGVATSSVATGQARPAPTQACYIFSQPACCGLLLHVACTVW